MLLEKVLFLLVIVALMTLVTILAYTDAPEILVWITIYGGITAIILVLFFSRLKSRDRIELYINDTNARQERILELESIMKKNNNLIVKEACREELDVLKQLNEN